MNVVGVLSGTSADGIDVAICQISRDASTGAVDLKQLFYDTVPFEKSLRERIFRLFTDKVGAQEMCQANFELGKAFGLAAQSAIERSGIPLDQIDLIASHGQTIWHDVCSNGKVTSTLQIGEPAVIAEITGVTTVGDFRVADVAAGGQGAPVTSTYDYFLLRPRSGTKWRALQNIGGIGNVTFVPPLSINAMPLAFDTGPGNVLMDWYASKISGGSKAFDENGEFAKKGKINHQLLNKMLSHEYFALKPPKTTGRELFSFKFGEKWEVEAKAMGLSDFDFLATLTEFTAASIAHAYQEFTPSGAQIGEVLISGGGALNPYLMERLKANLDAKLGYETSFLSHEDVGISSKGKEGQVFALLGFLCVEGVASSVPSCTGAQGGPRHLGKICPGRNFGKVILSTLKK